MHASNTLLIEGSFTELAEELAHYIDDIRKRQGDEAPKTWEDIEPLVQNRSPDDVLKKPDDVLKKLVTASSSLNAAPEKEFTAAYNLLVHLVRQSPTPDKFLPKICQNLTLPISSSPAHGSGLALSILATIFNLLPPDSVNRYNVFLAILKVIRGTSSFEALRTQLKNLETWIAQWDIDEEDQKKLYLEISGVADEAGEKDQAYFYLVRALRSIPSSDANTKEAQTLSVKALQLALADPRHFDFQDLTALDSVQSLRKSDQVLFELLEIFNAEQLDEFNDFQEEYEGWIEKHGLDPATLARKMRLLTLASLAASTQSRTLPYQHISRALQIPLSDVEMWVIDVIRAGLVEGKLSQLNQTFLIQRCTYRVFGEKQWAEVAGRLDTWRSSLEGVLLVVRQEREKILSEKEREFREMEGKVRTPGLA